MNMKTKQNYQMNSDGKKIQAITQKINGKWSQKAFQQNAAYYA